MMSIKSATAQSWTPFQFNEHYFISKSTTITEEPTVSFSKGEIINLISDYIVGDQYFPELMIGCDIRDRNSSCFGSYESCSDRFSWIGSPVVIETSQWSTINRHGDTLIFNPLSLVDTILRRSDTLYLSRFIEFETRNIKNLFDSVAIYAIEVRDSNGILTNNVWNGDTIILSKSFGLVQLPSWYLFPDYETWFEIFQHENTFDFTFNDVYPYQVGNILHFRYDWENGGLLSDKSYEKDVLKQCTIISVDSNAVANKFEVLCLVETIEKYYSSNYPYSIDSSSVLISTDTVWWTPSSLGLFDVGQIKISTAITLDGEDLEIHREDIWIGMPSALCPWEQHQFEPSYGSSTTIQVGMGEFEHHSFSLSNFPFGSYTTHNRKLEYFKSQNIEYGSPTWTVGLIEKELSPALLIWPNPTTNLVTIQSTSPIVQIDLFSSTGQIIKKIEVNNSESVEVQIGELPEGIYFLKIKSEKETVNKSVLKLLD